MKEDMNYPTMPAVPPTPPEKQETPNDRRRQLLLGSVVTLAVCGAFFTGGVVVGHYTADDGKPGKEASSVTDVVPADEPTEEEPEPEETPTLVAPAPDEFTVEMKVKSKQCFGSAGCNVTVAPELSYVGVTELDDGALYEITYEITGGEDGGVIETTEMVGGEYPAEETMVSTSSSSAKIAAEVTSVEVS